MTRSSLRLAPLLSALFLAAVAHGESVPRPSSGWVTDLTGTLSPSTIAQANLIASQVNDEGVGQIGVAVIHSTDGAFPRLFATDVFNRWGVGNRDRDDGVLLLIAIDDRKAEIILGDGIDDAARIRQTDAIMARDVVANMKRGNPDAAVLSATRALAGFLRSDPATSSSSSGGLRTFSGSEATADDGSIPLPSDAGSWALFGSVGLFGGGIGFGVRRYLRNRPRKCKGCGAQRMRLDEVLDDAHLNSGQRDEERFKSIDYDVWWCQACEDAVVLPYRRWFSGRVGCQQCGFRTAARTSLTLVAATYDHGGTVEVTERCDHCSHVRKFLRHTPRRQRSSSSSSSGFGGGSSSGGGSSGSW